MRPLVSSISLQSSFIRYSLIGVSGVTLDVLIFVLLFNILHLDPLAANVISTSCGIINNFFLNRHLNFKKKDFALLRFLSFYATGIAGIVVSTLILRVFHDFFGLNANLVKIASISVVVILQYGINKTFSFGDITSRHKTSLHIIRGFVTSYWAEIAVIIFAGFVFAVHIPTDLLGVDESDNFLSAQLLLQGQLPYADFFSHHMPGAYFMAIPFYILGNGDPLGFRIVYAVTIFSWLVANFLLIRRYINRVAGCWYVFLTAAAHGLLLQHMFLAETFVLFAISTCVIVLIGLPRQVLLHKRWIITLGLLLPMVTIMAVSYIYAVVILYLLLLARILPLPFGKIMRLAGIFSLPYIVFVAYLVSTRSFSSFVFDNLTFNAQYYGQFFGDIGGNPLTVGANVALKSLEQINTVLFAPISHPAQLVLLVSYLLLPVYLWFSGQKRLSLGLLVLLPFLNPRVGLYGPPGIATSVDQSVSQHAELYRGMAILCGALAVGYFAQKRSDLNAAPEPLRLAGSAVAITTLLLASVNICNAGATKYTQSGGLHQQIASYRALPNASTRVVNAVAQEQDYSWIGPIDFLAQTYTTSQQATDYTFFLPWHHICPTCRQQFYEQLEQDKPLVISWISNRTIVDSRPTPGYDSTMQQYLHDHYFQVSTDKPEFRQLYFRIDDRGTIIQRLKEAGYATQ